MSSLKSVLAIAGMSMASHAILPPMALANLVQEAYEKTIQPSPKASSTPKPTPPKKGIHVTPKGSATRGCGTERSLLPLIPSQQINAEKALIPKLSTGGFTTQAHPSFWFQVPFTAAELEKLEFILTSESGQTLDSTGRAVNHPSNLLQINLPNSRAGLEVDQRYRWRLKAHLNCGLDTSEEIEVQGWVQRHIAEASFNRQLAAATPLQQVQLHANQGIWFDALNLLAPLSIAEPQDAAIQQAWQDLLDLYAIELQPAP